MDKVQNLGNPKCSMPHQKTHITGYENMFMYKLNHLTTPAKLATFILVPLSALNSIIKLAQQENKLLLASF